MNSSQETDRDIWNEADQRSEIEIEIDELNSTSEKLTSTPSCSRSPLASSSRQTAKDRPVIAARFRQNHPETVAAQGELSRINKRVRGNAVHSDPSKQYKQVFKALNDLNSESLLEGADDRVHLIGHMQIFQAMYDYMDNVFEVANRRHDLTQSTVLYRLLYKRKEDEMPRLSDEEYVEYVEFCHRTQRNRRAANKIKDVVYDFMMSQ